MHLSRLLGRTRPASFVFRIFPGTTSFPQSAHLRSRTAPECQRPFTATAARLKKGNKALRGNEIGNKAADASENDVLDLSDLSTAIQSAIAKLREDLSKLRSGGRFNPEVLEDLRVSIEKGSSNTERLGDLASVVPKGRMVTIIVSDREHIKPISSAILGSKTLNLNPQPDPNNANQLVINLPPPTADSRKAVVADASRLAEVASTAIKNARGTQQKKLRAAEASKTARPDDVRTAGKSMEKLVSDASADVKKTLDAARKVLESA